MSGPRVRQLPKHESQKRLPDLVVHGKKRELKRRDTASLLDEVVCNEPQQPDIDQAQDAASQEDEFLIAADLTLYSNPVNRFMASAKAKNAPPAKPKAPQGAPPKAPAATAPPSGGKGKPEGKSHHDSHETIAADLTLYRGPMAALDAMHESQRVRNIQEGKRDDHHHYNKSAD